MTAEELIGICPSVTESDIIIVILSKNYFESTYCCNEMGYIWATNKPTFIFGLVGINNSNDYLGFMNNDWIVRKLSNRNDIYKFYELLIKKMPVRKQITPTEFHWRFIDEKIRDIGAWLDKINRT